MIANQYESSSRIGKFAALIFLNQLVDQFDVSIKTLKSSDQYKDKQLQSERFRLMLDDYFDLLDKLVRIPSIQKDLTQLIDTQTFNTVDAYLQEIKNLMSKNPASPAQMNPASDFNVAAAALGSKALWQRRLVKIQPMKIFLV